MNRRPLKRRAVTPFHLSAAASLVLSGLSALSPQPATAQLPPPKEEPAIGARMPAVSPDGKQLAFVWRGDIWVSPISGGRAYPVTSHVEYDSNPIFSPDGNWIAFSSNRNGNADIFIVPSNGGVARQITFSSGGETATDWTPDGKYLIFSGRRDTANAGIFAIDVETLRFKRLTEDYKNLNEATYSPDGKTVAFQRYGFPWTRPRYHGSAAAQLWTLDLATGKRTTVVDDEKQHLWPRFLPSGKQLVAVSVSDLTPNAQWLNKPLPPLKDSPARTPNLWSFPADGKGAPKQLTKFVGGSVRFPAVARKSGDIVFEYGVDLYRLAPGATEPKKLTLYCGGEDKQNNVVRQVFTNSDVEEAEISPDGKTFGFVIKGDLWTIPVEKAKTRNADDAVRLTDYPGFDRDFNWSKDGKQIFFVSDRSGNDRVFAMDVETKKVRPLWEGKDDAGGPSITPDGKLVAFWVRGKESEAGLYVKPTAVGDAGVPAKRLVAVPAPLQGQYSFSPDNKWIAFTRRGAETGGMNIYIMPMDGSKPAVNVTRLNAYHGQPVWSPDGKYLFFQSTRDDNGLYVLPLKPEDARSDELVIKYEKPKAPVAIEIDFEDTAQRIRKVTGQSPDADLAISDEGQIYFVSGGDAYQASFDGKEVKKLTSTGGVSSLRTSPDGKTLFFRRNGALVTLKTGAPGYPTTPVAFNAEWERNVRAERAAAFNQLWRSYNTRFYDGNFHGRDWASIRKRYEPMLNAVGTREELATVMNMMIGEIEASHSEVGAAPSPIASPSTRQLGVYFDYSYNGPGIKVKDVPKRAPGSYAKTRIKPGEYIVAVDGKDVTLDENLYKTLDVGDRDLILLVNDKPTRQGARTVTYHALTGGELSDLYYRNRVEWLRKEVDQKSGGTVAYVHIAGMGGPNQTTFDREFYEYSEGKKAVIIDVRFNGGGNIADTLVSWLAIKPYGVSVPRDGYPSPAPGRSWNKPIIVLMNEHSYSNAEMFPDYMRATGLAKLVGMPTPGYVIWTGGLPLVDGTNARMPGSGVFRKDGSPMENLGEKPDVTVPLSNEDWMANRDPQLDKAIEMLMK
jgi:tricorn protease